MQIPNGSIIVYRTPSGGVSASRSLQGSPVVFDLRAYDHAAGRDQSARQRDRAALRRGDRGTRPRASRRRPRRLAGIDSRRVLRAGSRRCRAASSACGRSTSRSSPPSRSIAATSSRCRPARGRRSPPSCRPRFAPSPAQGVHVLTFNDYLARRDAEWMGPVYAMLGLSVGFVQQGMTPDERRRAYLADVTYVTAKEAGFDHLRDLLAMDRARRSFTGRSISRSWTKPTRC